MCHFCCTFREQTSSENRPLLKALPLDFNGAPTGDAVPSQPLQLRPATLYYLLTP